MKDQEIVKISAIVYGRHFASLVDSITKAGIKDYYTTKGRAPALEEGSGLLSFLTNKKQMTSRPVEIITCYTEKDKEEEIMNLLADAGHFDTPGKGAIYSEAVAVKNANKNVAKSSVSTTRMATSSFYDSLVGVCCVVQRGQGDAIAKIALENGLGTPIITYGSGMGIRDKLGLLRITIPAEKFQTGIRTFPDGTLANRSPRPLG